MSGDSPGERWDRRWKRRELFAQPSVLVTRLEAYLPDRGSALDVAGGAGRHTIWLAEHGLEVTNVDASSVALARCRSLAAERGLVVETLERDLEEHGLPEGDWDVMLVHHFFDRALLGSAPASLLPGGLLAFCQPTVRNLERHNRPSRRFLLAEGEIRDVAEASGLEVLLLEEGWQESGRHEGWFVGRK